MTAEQREDNPCSGCGEGNVKDLYTLLVVCCAPLSRRWQSRLRRESRWGTKFELARALESNFIPQHNLIQQSLAQHLHSHYPIETQRHSALSCSPVEAFRHPVLSRPLDPANHASHDLGKCCICTETIDNDVFYVCSSLRTVQQKHLKMRYKPLSFCSIDAQNASRTPGILSP